ncbi:MAG: glycosyltransferase [Candidatus Competibacteraceae bacterium]|nr:glycosyltransferase [Candidatus Competibacteraceae bacterium]
MMRIALMCKSDRFGGGASRVGEDLCCMLNDAGHEAHLYLSFAIGEHAPYMRPLYSPRRRFDAMARYLNRVSTRAGLHNIIPSELVYLWLSRGYRDYDVFHFHDLSTAISPITPWRISRSFPTVWTFHDCSAFTGGCIYPGDCTRYKHGCGRCPQIGQWPLEGKRDGTRTLLRIKQRALAAPKLKIVTPSRWMAQLAMNSGSLKHYPRIIPNGVDTSVFLPHPKAEVRDRLGLPRERPIVLFTAGPLHEARKGLRYALDALNAMADIDPLVLLIGKEDPENEIPFSGLDLVRTGYLQDEAKKALYFAAADVFLFTSLEDNLPLSILETMAAGTPVVGFDTGGVPEMIAQGVEGHLVPQRDGAGLVVGLREALTAQRAASWGKAARKRIEKDFSHQLFFERHLQLYSESIDEFRQ